MTEQNTDIFNQEELYVGKIMKVKIINKNDCQFVFVKYGIFKQTQNPNEYVHCLTGKTYKIFTKNNLVVGQKGFLKKDIVPMFEHFQKSYKYNPDLANKPLTAYDLIQFEKKLTQTYINNNNPNPQDKKD